MIALVYECRMFIAEEGAEIICCWTFCQNHLQLYTCKRV